MRQRMNWTAVVKADFFRHLSIFLAVGVLLFSASTSSAFQIDVVDQDGAPLATGFRWLVEADNTVQKPVGIQSARSSGVQIHKSYTPVLAEGESTTSSDTVNLPDGRYVVSIRPFDGYTTGAAIIAKGQTSATIKVHELPLPTTQLSILVFQDHGSINNAPDLNVWEPGLEGFSIQIHDFGGRVLQDAFGNPLGTEYEFNNGVPVYENGAPKVTSLGNGLINSDVNGEAIVKYLPPGKYGVLVAAPPAEAEDWVQTATIEGTRTVDVWVKPDEPASFIEGFGPGFYHAFIGFVRASDLPWTNPLHPDYVDRSAETGTITGINRFNHFSRPPRLQGFFAGPTVDGCWVGLNDPATGQGLYAAPCEGDSSFTISNVPPGTYELVTWDENLDALFGAHTVIVPPDAGGGEDQVNLGNVLSFRWFGTLKGSIFLDSNENGYRDPGETGLANHDVLLRFRNGSVYKLQTSDIFGDYEFAEVFPFFKWLVTEVGFATLKATGMTAIIDNGGPVDPNDPFAKAAGINTTGWPTEAIGTLNPQPQFRHNRGPITYDPTTDTFSGVERINPNTGNNLSRTETGVVLTEAMMLFLNQTNIIDWGKNNYSPGENGGISGLVIYNVTRPNDDPVNEAQEDYEPGIPFVQVNLYLDDDGDGVIDDADGNGIIRRADFDNYPLGNFPGPEDVDRAPKGVFNWGDAVNVTWTDSWDEDLPEGCIQNIPVINGVPTKECFDNFGTWNQVRQGLFDGGFAFESYFPNGPAGVELSPLPESEFIVEAAPPLGYTVTREEDKNVDFGETFTPSPLALPFACVGKLHTVPDYMSFQLDEAGQPYTDIAPADLVASVFAGQDRPLCDRKQVSLVEGKNTGVEFYFHTRVPKAARNVGFVNNDLAAEFDETSPIFGEKASPPGFPISYKDFRGNEVVRVYSDEFGAYNALLPSAFSNSVPSPSGFAPNMLTLVLNDPGPIPDPDNPGQMIIDPAYNPNFATSPWTWQYTPGQVTYTDTPIVPLGAFATLPPGDRLWSEPTYQTPVPASIERKDPATGAKTGPLVCAADDVLVIKSGVGTGDASGFGLSEGQVDIVDPATGTAYPLTVTLWTREKVKVTVPQAVLDGGFAAGQLVITKANGLASITSATVRIWDCAGNAPIIVAQDGSGDFSTIQEAIDDTGTLPGDLVIVRPGVYRENVILHKEIILQGSGAGSDTGANTTTLSGVTVPRNNLDAWHAKVLAITGADPFGANEAPTIMVLGDSLTTSFIIGGPHAHIDGFHILGGIAGGGIYIASDTDGVEISNNKITGNQGTFGGGITVGTPDTGVDANNDAVYIHHNHITKNGGVQGGGGINLYTGSDLYKIEHNLISANFSRYTGGGINHIGYSNGGQIVDNQILFNEVFFGALLEGVGDGAGIYIAGEVIEGDGAGDVTIDANLIQGNLVGSGYGGGIMAWAYNSSNELSTSQLTLTNNIIVNNVAGLAAGGVYLHDVAHADIVNNTIVNNDSTASANVAFAAGQINSTPQIGGVAIAALNPTLETDVTDLSDVSLINNIISGNRSFFNDASLNNSTGGLSVASNHAAAMVDTALDYPDVWDLDIGGPGAVVENNLLTSLTRSLTLPATTGPEWDYTGNGNAEETPALAGYRFVKPYQNALVSSAVLDEGGNAITIRYTPLDASAGDYRLMASSEAVDAGQAVGGIATAAYDFEGDLRPNGVTAEDIGADEYYAPDAAAVTVISPNGGDLLPAGSTFPVCWEAPAAATSFNAKYSLDGGQNWLDISLGVSGNCTDWTVPTALPNQKNILVKVRGNDSGGALVGIDVSDAPFAIAAVRLLTPNGGATLTEGGSYAITWQSYDPTNFDSIVVEYRKRVGGAWLPITSLTSLGGVDPGSYTWNPIDGLNSLKTDMVVRVSAYDSSGTLIARDKSDAGNIMQPAVVPE